MRKRRDGFKPRQGYHHGNLKEALVEAGRQLIMEKGPLGFSLVEAAKIAKVSPAAPYRHFPNRTALLEDIAKRGFTRFAETLEKAWQDGTPDAAAASERICVAYLKFAAQDKASFAAMFEARLENTQDKDLKAATKRAFGSFYKAAEALHELLTKDRATDLTPELIFAHIWSLSHGIARLYGAGSGSAPVSGEDMPSSEILERGIRTYLQGLAAQQCIKSASSNE